MVSKRCLFENTENLKGHQTPNVYNSLALGPSKNSPLERFWTNMNKYWNVDHKWKLFKFQKPLNLFACKHQTRFCHFVNKSKNWCQKGCPKVIVDAERHRRTPRLWATSIKTIYCRRIGLTQSESMRDTGQKLVTLTIPAERSWNYAKIDADINKYRPTGFQIN